jgi:multiple sugar transport system ATP-binding protein
MAEIRVVNLTKRFGDVIAVDNINLTVEDREFVVLVGPSGCGKTTTLRMIAGLEPVSEGEIFIGEQKVNRMPPKDRDIAMVFQNYALYPHMDVYKNMSFGLRLRKFSYDVIKGRVQGAAKILGLQTLLARKPRELSGGQRQRVAMGRAIVRKPKAFLFDEPLSNLDAKLRVQMRAELAKLHQRMDTTVVYVTHDQVEAMTLAERVVVMDQGRIMQVGAPLEVYNQPKKLFVAGFIGSPAMNFLDVIVRERNGSLRLEGDGFQLRIPDRFRERYRVAAEKKAVLGIRPEHIADPAFKELSAGCEKVRAQVEVVEPLGSQVILIASHAGLSLTACVDPETKAKPGREMDFLMDMNKMHLFDRETGEVY